jgi:hypothetical protein
MKDLTRILSPGVDMDPQHLQAALKFLVDLNFSRSPGLDLSKPMLRPAFRGPSALLAVMLSYAALVLIGCVANGAVVCVAAGRMRTRRVLGTASVSAHAAMVGLACVFIPQLTVVVPLSVFVLVVHNWVLGPVMCRALPMVQVSHRPAPKVRCVF